MNILYSLDMASMGIHACLHGQLAVNRIIGDSYTNLATCPLYIY